MVQRSRTISCHSMLSSSFKLNCGQHPTCKIGQDEMAGFNWSNLLQGLHSGRIRCVKLYAYQVQFLTPNSRQFVGDSYFLLYHHSKQDLGVMSRSDLLPNDLDEILRFA